MKSTQRLGLFATALAGVVALGACGGSSSPSQDKTITSGDAQVVAQGAASQVGSIASGLTSFGVSDPTGGFGGFFGSAKRPALHLLRLAQAGAPARMRPMLAKFANLATPEACDFGGTADTGSSTDSDADGIPDNQVLTFVNCVVLIDTTQVDTETVISTFTITGSLGIADSKATGDLLAYSANVGNLVLSEVQQYSASGTYSLAFGFDGSFGGRWAPALAASTENLTFDLTLSIPTAARFTPAANTTYRYSYLDNFTVDFAPDQGSSIALDQAFPSGLFSFGGDFRWSGDDGTTSGNWQFDLSTDSPGLSYDSGCAADPPFTGGVVRGAIHVNDTVGFTVTYGGCGLQPTVDVFGTTS
jgi:hypothetical protein